MDDFVELMLKKSKENEKTKPNKMNDIDEKEIEKLLKQIQDEHNK